MEGVSFKPKLVTNEKSVTPRVVIRKGQKVEVEKQLRGNNHPLQLSKSMQNSTTNKNSKQQTKDNIMRLFQYGQQIKEKRQNLKKMKDSLEESQFNF